MGSAATLDGLFAEIVDLCAALEDTTVPPRVRTRIANAYKRSVDKGLSLTWREHVERRPEVINWFLRRHAERGARDFVP